MNKKYLIIIIIVLLALNVVVIFSNIKMTSKNYHLKIDNEEFERIIKQFNLTSNIEIDYNALSKDINLNKKINIVIQFQDLSCSECNKWIINNLNQMKNYKLNINIFYNGKNEIYLGIDKLSYSLYRKNIINTLSSKTSQSVIFIFNNKNDLIWTHQPVVGRKDITDIFFRNLNLLLEAVYSEEV